MRHRPSARNGPSARNECHGKIAFKSERQAANFIRWGDSKGWNTKHFRAYLCSHCLKWHTGHQPRSFYDTNFAPLRKERRAKERHRVYDMLDDE